LNTLHRTLTILCCFPQNRLNKTGFEKTTREARTELFRSIGHAINNGGEGLRTLEYQPHPDAEPIVLLTDPEAVHLEDVAKLIDLLEPIGWAATVLLVVLMVLAIVGNISLPGLKVSLLTLLVIALLLTVVIVVVGPRDVFSALHEFVFPADHQWPDIFFAIGAVWAALAVIIYLMFTFLFRLIERTRS